MNTNSGATPGALSPPVHSADAGIGAGPAGAGGARGSGEAGPEDGSHTVGRWLTDRAAQSPRRIAIDDRGVTIDYATLALRAK